MIRGSCQCQAVLYEAEGPQLFFVYCHCRWCRRAHGTGSVPWVGVPESGFRLVRGEDAVRWYASSPRSRRGFCVHCGSTMFFASTAAPGELHLSAGCVDEGLRGEPTAHVFVDQKAPWIELTDALPQRTEASPGLAAFRGDPRG
jgi:hypothetical protein